MDTPTLEQISELQKQYGVSDLQNMINTGHAWKMEGHYGRTAMASLENGATMLPEERMQDYYGTTVPSRNDLKPGTTGTLLNSQNFWQKVLDGEIDLAEPGEEE
jgi:hypothetical protein